jgi:ribosome-binding protein aMBF1 (putative translation factor)
VRRFAGELSNAMARRGIGPTALGRMIGASPTMVHNWKRGVSTPIHRTVLVLSEALDWEQLIAVSIEERTRECEICGASIFDESPAESASCAPEGGRRLLLRMCSGWGLSASEGV